MEEGLAASGGASAPRVTEADIIEQIIALLQQGITPEELVKQGAPPELVEKAMQILAQQSQAAPAPEGLAASGAPMAASAAPRGGPRG